MKSSLLSAEETLVCVKVFQKLTSDVRQHWDVLSNDSIFTPYQSIRWYEAWLRTVGPAEREEPLIVVAFDASGAPTLILPLVVVRRGRVVIAKFPGGKHANYNFPLIRNDVALTDDTMDVVGRKVAEAGIDVDLYWFDALPSKWVHKQNPLLRRPYCQQAAASSVIDLEDEIPSQRLAVERRASDRRLLRRGAIVTRAAGATEVGAALREFFAQKSEWFRVRNLPNSFESDGIPCFFRDIFSDEAHGELHVLSLDGATLAVAGLLVSPDRASLMFISYDQHHKAAKLSPGTHLLRRLVSDIGERGIAQFDFGLGEAGYKRLLGARTEPVFVSMKAMTAKGHVAGAVLALSNILKGHIKKSPRLSQLLQSLHHRWRNRSFQAPYWSAATR